MDGNATTITTLPHARLRVWPGNPRKTVPDLTDLTASVAKSGVLSPLLVRELPAPAGAVTHEVIAGQCRWLAAGRAGLAEVPVLVRAIDDATALELGLVENAQRNAPAPLEEAEAIDTLVRAHGRSVDDVAARLGRPVAWARRRLSLLWLVAEARRWLTSGKLPLGHALALAAIDPAAQRQVVERWRVADELPPARRWGSEVTLCLRTLASAPFDADDAALPGGACGPCPRSTTAQADLFGVDPNARCTDPTCWAAKVDATWTAAQKAAKKRRLPVIPDAVDPSWRGVVCLPDGRLLTTAAPAEDTRPVAVARDQHGRVVDLYEPPPAPADGDAEAPDDVEAPVASDDREARAAARTAAAQERKAAADAARLATIGRLTEALATPAGLVAGLRLALLTVARDLDMTRDLRAVLETRGHWPAVFLDAELASETPAGDLVLVLAATLCAAWATDPDADDAEPLERDLRALLVASPPEAPAAPPPAPAATVRVWVAEAAWDALTEDTRDDLADVMGHAVEWQGTEGYVFADVPPGALPTLRGMLEALEVGAVEGAERPAAPAPPATVVLAVKRGDWLQHRSGLRDTAKAPLHKRWDSEGENRVVEIARGDELVGKVLAYCADHGVKVYLDGQLVGAKAEEKPAAKGRAKGAK